MVGADPSAEFAGVAPVNIVKDRVEEGALFDALIHEPANRRGVFFADSVSIVLGRFGRVNLGAKRDERGREIRRESVRDKLCLPVELGGECRGIISRGGDQIADIGIGSGEEHGGIALFGSREKLVEAERFLADGVGSAVDVVNVELQCRQQDLPGGGAAAGLAGFGFGEVGDDLGELVGMEGGVRCYRITRVIDREVPSSHKLVEVSFCAVVHRCRFWRGFLAMQGKNRQNRRSNC